MDPALEQLARNLAKLATHYDFTGHWPEKSLHHLTQAGAWTWVVPRSHGGRQLSPLEQAQAYEAVASGCMACLLILTQRDAACELIAAGDSEALKDEILPRLARHEVMTTVGISQLTTSHRTGRPALVAKAAGDGFVLNGFMPWVTAADRCQYLVTGAELPDGNEILAAVPSDLPGVTIDKPMDLMALQHTATSEVHCRNVHIERRFVLKGPMKDVLSSRSTVKPFVVASAGVGLAGTMSRLVALAAEKAGGELAELGQELVARHEAIRERLYKAVTDAGTGGSEDSKTQLRIAVNDLLVRLAIALLTLSKGSGFQRQRDAQRLAREALFFLVWSAPDDVRAGTLAAFVDHPAPAARSMEWR